MPGCPCSISTVGLQPDPLFPPRSGIFHLDLASGCCGERWGSAGCPGHPWDADSLLSTELLSAENGSACSPRLSPDGQRLLYLEGAVGGPHRQCLRLRMVSGASRLCHLVLPAQCPGVTASRSAWLEGGGVPKPLCISFPQHGSIPEHYLSPAHLADKADGDSARRGSGAHRG